MKRSGSGVFVFVAVILAGVAAAVLASTNFFSSLPFMMPSARELVAQMTGVVVEGGIAVTFSKADAAKWEIGPGQKLEKLAITDDGAVIARLTSTGTIDLKSFNWPEMGLSATLPPEFAKKSNGRRLEIGFVARAPQANPAAEVSVIYATQQAGNSTWRQFKLSPTFELMKFTYDVPKQEEGYSKNPIVVFHSDATGFGRSVELLGVYVKIVPQT